MKKDNIYLFITLICIALILSAVCIINIRIIKAQQINDKNIVYQILGSFQETDDIVMSTALALKEKDNIGQIEVGKSILSKYGYTEKYQSIIDKQFAKVKLYTIIIYILIYIAFIITICIIYKINKAKQAKQEKSINQIIQNMQNSNYDNYIDMKNNINSRTIDLLESLANQTKLTKARLIEEKEETKSLVTDISHQLKTPIASLKLSIDLIDDETLNQAERNEFIDRAKYQIEHLENLVQALVDISRLEANMISIQIENNCIMDTILEAVNMVYVKANNKNIDILVNKDVDDIDKLLIPHDKKWTAEAIFNILDNAIKYSKASSTININIYKSISYLCIDIIGEGIGINRSEYNKIFQRFYRGNSDLIHKQEGSGVGLFLTRRIIEQQGGSVFVAANQDAGSKFTIQLRLSN